MTAVADLFLTSDVPADLTRGKFTSEPLSLRMFDARTHLADIALNDFFSEYVVLATPSRLLALGGSLLLRPCVYQCSCEGYNTEELVAMKMSNNNAAPLPH